MTDSDSELTNPNVFTFQNVNNTTVSARGPNTNISNFSFRNQLTSTMCMQRNFERQRYAESLSDQRSIYYRRETSPMSIHSACDIRPRNYQQCYNGMGSQQSVYNGRSGSPISMRSIDSNASVSAADIAFAFKNVKFNKYDLKVIKDAYHKLMKQRVRKRIEKRRNMKLFLKGSRRRSGYDSGELGSDSSISSDDCRSVKTSYNEHISSSKSARIDLSDFRRTVKDSTMYNDCTDNLKQNNFKNMFSVNNISLNRNQNITNSFISKPNNPIPSLKERFKNGFLLPSQRFNRSVASSVIPENSVKNHRNMNNGYRENERHTETRNCESASEEEIFSGKILREKSNENMELQRKRSLDIDDESCLPSRKKSKISSPAKNCQPNKKTPSKTIKTNAGNNNNDIFEFAKPTLPVRKSKSKVQEMVIAKSKQPLTGFVEPISNKIANDLISVKPINDQEKPNDDVQKQADVSGSTLNSDVSMRPSFIKRKLFTQNLDVAEKANSSSDGTNSPQSNVYSGLSKEKNKARKLVTSQSCLNRDVQEDNNYLDLIHKIVPPEQMNVTSQTTINQTVKSDVNSFNKKDDDDRWDVTSVISTCNENDVSDTFTDEEIFKSDNTKIDAKKNKKEKSSSNKSKIEINGNDNSKIVKNIKDNHNNPRECRIVVEKMPNNQDLLKSIRNQDSSLTEKQNNLSKNVIKNSAKTFWDTDFESDAECSVPAQRTFLKETQSKGTTVVGAPLEEFKQPAAVQKSPVSKCYTQSTETSKWLNNTKNTTLMNNTLDSSRKINNISTLSVRSHRTSKKKKCCNEPFFEAIKSKPQTTEKSKPVINNKITTKPDSRNKKPSDPETNCRTTAKPEKCNMNLIKPISTKPESKGKNLSKPESNGKKLSKPEGNGNSTTPKSRQTSVEQQKKSIQNKISTTETKSNKQNKSRSTSRTRKSPNKINNEPVKKNRRPINSEPNHLSPNDRPIRSCRATSQNRSIEDSRSSGQFNVISTHSTKNNKGRYDTTLYELLCTPEVNRNQPKSSRPATESIKKHVERANNKSELQKKSSINPKTSSLNIKKSTALRKSPRKLKSKEDKQIGKNISYLSSPRIDRPIRSCRTPSQNRSIENYKSTMKRR